VTTVSIHSSVATSPKGDLRELASMGQLMLFCVDQSPIALGLLLFRFSGAVRHAGGGAAASETSDLWPTATAQTIKIWDTSSLSAAATPYPVCN
jgi:hypothetical protein